jgi:hypothetical protein
MEASPLDVSFSKPIVVDLSVKLLYALTLLGIASFIVDFEYTIARFSVTDTLVNLIIPVAVMVFMIAKISSGRNWARIIFALMYLLGIRSFVEFAAQELSRNWILGAISIIQGIAHAVCIILLFTPNAAPWFTPKKSDLDDESYWSIIGNRRG